MAKRLALLLCLLWLTGLSAQIPLPVVQPIIQPYAAHEARVVRVIDGDTFVADIDLEFGVSITLTVRVHDYSAPELNTEEGRFKRDLLISLMASADNRVVLRSYRGQQTFARWVCDVWIAGRPFAEAMQ